MDCCQCGNPAQTAQSNPATRIVYGCAGCSDVGEISDLVSRALRKKGYAIKKQSCLAGIGSQIPTFINAAKNADQIIAIDGCELACARKMLEQANLKPVSVILTELGLEKGFTPPTAEIVERMSLIIMEAN